ncbi:transporter substrate-binding domain-containing protein, partial [Salmonella enterica]|nr:transporter substrate-binding domain-containing protein [Salmonella enterica]
MARHRWAIPLAALALRCGAAAAEEAPAPQPAPQATASVLDRVIASHQLRVGLTGDYRPFSLQDAATGAFTGLDVDLTTGLARALGAEPVFVHTSWPTLMADFQAGKFDVLAGGVSVTLDRQRVGFFSVPTDVDGKAAIARCADAARYDGLDAIDRPDVRVVVNPGGTNERFDRAHLHNAQILTFPDNKAIFREVAEGRADVMITDGVETRLQQKLNPGLCAIHPDRPFDRAEKAWLLPRDIAFKLFV